MRFKLPGSRINVRLFERVETANDTYDIFDVGVEFTDKDKNVLKIDSVAVGGSFASAKAAISAFDKKQEDKQVAEEAKETAPAVLPLPLQLLLQPDSYTLPAVAGVFFMYFHLNTCLLLSVVFKDSRSTLSQHFDA